MKFNNAVSSSIRKQRKRQLGAPAHVKRVLMSAPLSKELKEKYGIAALPVRKNDEVKIIKGGFKSREGKVKSVYRLKNCIAVDRVQTEKANGTQVDVPVQTSNVVITKLFLDDARKAILDKKAAAKQQQQKAKVSDKDVKMA